MEWSEHNDDKPFVRRGVTVEQARRIALDDSTGCSPRSRFVIVGCGNLLRGDDAVGPILIRHLWERGLADIDGVTLVDGGTAGMDIAFKMHGAERVILVDASATGVAPGTLYRVPGQELEHLPGLQGLHSHQFRWDHALAFARWLLADDYPENIEVFLIEAASTEPGAPLSDPVTATMNTVIDLIADAVDAPSGPGRPGTVAASDRASRVETPNRTEGGHHQARGGDIEAHDD